MEEERQALPRRASEEEKRQRGVLVANMLLTLIFICLLLTPVRLYYDGLAVPSTWLSVASLATYAALLWLARWRRDYGHLSAWLTCIYINGMIFWRTVTTYGVRSEVFSWFVMVPAIVFCLLGQRAGVLASVLVLIESWLTHLYTSDEQAGRLFELSCVRLDHDQGSVFVPFDCAAFNQYGIKVGSFASSTTEIITSKSLIICLMGAFAYIYESNRCDALRRMKEALQQKEKVNASLRQATNAKTAFLANMSHELRTPMHGIIAMAKDLMEMPLSESARESAKIVSDCADHLLGLVNDILDFARIESNQLELEVIGLSVVDEVEKAVSLQAAMAKKKRVTLTTHIDVGEALRAGDPLRFRQILINLLSNAIKFTPEDGRVAVSAFAGAARSSDPELITVSVADTGIGIPNQFLDHIFESFSQLDASVGRKFGGSGLGLAISRKLCRAMGGGIWVTSEEGKGSVFTFTVRLPLSDHSTALSYGPGLALTPLGESASSDAVRGAKVLVVEDNATNQKVAIKMLTSLGCRVQIANHGAEGVDMFEKEAFDVILMDVQMPVMDGFQATARIRQIEQQRRNSVPFVNACPADEDDGHQYDNDHVDHDQQHQHQRRRGQERGKGGRSSRMRRMPIIALTASATYDYKAECLEKGMDRFLTKPLKKETLQRVLAEILFLGP